MALDRELTIRQLPGVMTYEEFATDRNLSDSAIARATDLDRFHLNRIRNGHRPLARETALRIWSAYGVKLAPIAEVPDVELEVLARYARAS